MAEQNADACGRRGHAAGQSEGKWDKVDKGRQGPDKAVWWPGGEYGWTLRE